MVLCSPFSLTDYQKLTTMCKILSRITRHQPAYYSFTP